MHCGVKVMSKVKERRLAETAEGCRRLRRLPKAVKRLAGLSGAAEGCRKLARVKGLSKAVGVVEGCGRLPESAEVEGVVELMSTC